MRTAAICPTCSVYENALCILYNGPYLANIDVNPLDSLEVALGKVNNNLVPKSGTAAPSAAAIYLGQLYVRTAGSKNLYYAQTTGTGALDWRIVLSIPAKKVVPELIAKGYVTYPYIGATIQSLIPEMAKYLKHKIERGAMISEVVKGGPADKAGLKGGNQRVQVGNMIVLVGGDIVVKSDQKEVKNNDELIRYIREKKPGDTVLLKVFRKDSLIDLKVTLGERPKRK